MTQTEALYIIFSYKCALNKRGGMGRNDIFSERNEGEGLRAGRELSRCEGCTDLSTNITKNRRREAIVARAF